MREQHNRVFKRVYAPMIFVPSEIYLLCEILTMKAFILGYTPEGVCRNRAVELNPICPICRPVDTSHRAVELLVRPRALDVRDRR